MSEKAVDFIQLRIHKYLVHICAMGHALYEVPGTGPWTACGLYPVLAPG